MRRAWKTSLWIVLAAFLGCSSMGSGCSSCGGCTPIPGGFPLDQRQNNAATVKVTKSGLESLMQTVMQALGAGGTGQITYNLSCMAQSVPIYGGISTTVYICDMDHDNSCDGATDSDTSSRQNEPGHGVDCQIIAKVDSISIAPTQNADGTVDVAVTLNAELNTGKIFIDTQSVPLLCSGGMRCSAEYDSSAPIPITAHVQLTVDSTWHDLLAANVTGLDDITKSLNPSDLTIASEPGTCTGLACSVLNNDSVKQALFSQLQGMLASKIDDQLDKFRCEACASDGSCPATSTCDSSLGVCYTDQSSRACPPREIGGEGRVDLGSYVASLGGPKSAPLDVYLVAGGRNPDGTPSVAAQTGGLVLGMMGGTRAPSPSLCAPPTKWTAPPPPTPMDFHAEAQTAPAIASYTMGLALSDNYLNKSFYDAWQSGLLCLDVSASTTSYLTSSLFGTFMPSLGELTHGQDVPMMVTLRPLTSPTVLIGRGTTKTGANGQQVPDDPLLTIQMKSLQIDFYAFIEERYTRLFSLVGDLKLPLSLDFDPSNNTVTPVLGDLSTLLTNLSVRHEELISDDPSAIEALIPQVIGLVQPALAGVLKPITLPAVQGFNIQILAARGSVPNASGPGYQHLALFTNLSQAQPDIVRLDTRATLVGATMPSLDEARAGAQPLALVGAQAVGIHPADSGFEYDYRVDGGFWSEWQSSSDLRIAAPELALQGTHDIEVRARIAGESASADRTPAVVPFVTDYEPPDVRLALDPDTRTVETIAHDAVTPDDELAFRYRVAGAAWTPWDSPRTFALSQLGTNPSLEAEAKDTSGHIGRATFGIPAEQIGTPSKAPQSDSTGGCTSVPVAALALAGLLARKKRRKKR